MRAPDVFVSVALTLFLAACSLACEKRATGSSNNKATHVVADVKRAFAERDLPLEIQRVPEPGGFETGEQPITLYPAGAPILTEIQVWSTGEDALRAESYYYTNGFMFETDGHYVEPGNGIFLREANVVVLYDSKGTPDRLTAVRAALESLGENG